MGTFFFLRVGGQEIGKIYTIGKTQIFKKIEDN